MQPEAGAALPAEFLSAPDGFAARVQAELAEVLAAASGAALLAHCTTVATVRAGAKWQRRCTELAAGYPQASATFERILRLVLETKVTRLTKQIPGYFFDDIFLASASSQFARGAIWGYATLAGLDAAPLLGDVAVRCGAKVLSLPGSMLDGPIANAAVAALGSLDGEAAVEQLRRVQRMAEHRTFVKSIAAAFDAAALRSGLTREQIVERGIPAHGLGADGRYAVALDDEHVAAIVVDPDGRAALEYNRAGTPVRSLPAAMQDAHAPAVKALKARLKELQTTLRSERDRIQAILATDRTWSAAEWSAYYPAHPLTGPLARRLIWEASAGPDGPWFAGIPEACDAAPATAWRLRGPDGAVRELADSDTVRLWHPIRAAVADIESWRAYLTDAAVRQPFKQAFRELYRLTPAEAAAADFSHRFVGHILLYRQTKALTVERGWSGLSLGDWYEGDAAEAVHEFPGTSWRARFALQTATTSPHTRAAVLCTTGEVRFETRGGKAWRGAGLADVPPAVLSEAMRDVDLFVGVASIGADPLRSDGDARQRAYWQEFGFGELSESAHARRATLARLLPRTRIADRVELDGRFLRVRGGLRAYRIHLGSGHVVMEPDDTYLCIVDARSSQDAARLFLPFEENGGMLSLIVSKAFLLADDLKISDVSILRQIRAR